MHPTKQKSPHRAEAAPQVRILSASLRDHRAQFGKGKRAEEGKDRAHNPRREDDGNRAPLAGHFRGLQENSRSDHGADHDGHGGPRAETAHEFQAFFAHGTSAAVVAAIPWDRPPGESVIPRLTAAPTKKVVSEPIITYQVKAMVVKRKTHRIVASPAIMPASAPFAWARRSMVPSKNNPSRLPSGNAATVNPVSSSGPHFMNPKASSTPPQSRVASRDARRRLAELSAPVAAGDPPRREKSRTLEAASEFSEPLALDIATATMEASSNPAKPTGISRTRNSGKIRSVRSPGASNGQCCAKT